MSVPFRADPDVTLLPGRKILVAQSKAEIQHHYEAFKKRKTNDKCSLEQFVLIGHSHSATAIYELINEGYFFKGDAAVQPAALIMIDAVLGGRTKDITGAMKKSKKTDVFTYYQTDDIPIIRGTPVKGTTPMVVRGPDGKSWVIIKGGVTVQVLTWSEAATRE